MKAPLASIIIPSFNSAQWLGKTVESALAQTWPEKEIIVVDDGSTDGSLALARHFESQGVRVATQSNAGAAAARNTGLKIARGDYLQFLDADDLLAPDKLERQIRRLQADGSEYTLMRATATWLLPRGMVEKIGPWNTDYRSNPLDDMDYFDRARAAARTVVFCGETRTYYRSELTGSLSRVRSPDAWRAISATLHRSVDLLLKLEDSPRTRHAGATMLQRFIYESYPALPELAATAAARVRQLGGTDLQPEFGPNRERLAALIGWKLTKRLHDLIRGSD